MLDSELTKFAKQIESNEKEQKQKKKGIRLERKDTIKSRMNLPVSHNGDENIVFNNGKFEIKDNEQLRKYEAIYIPTLPSSIRKSDIDRTSRGMWIVTDSHRKRLSERRHSTESLDDNVKIIE